MCETLRETARFAVTASVTCGLLAKPLCHIRGIDPAIAIDYTPTGLGSETESRYSLVIPYDVLKLGGGDNGSGKPLSDAS